MAPAFILRFAILVPARLLFDGAAERPGGFQVAQRPARGLRTRVVRIAGQVLLQAGGQFVQSVRAPVHPPIVARTGVIRIAQGMGVCA